MCEGDELGGGDTHGPRVDPDLEALIEDLPLRERFRFAHRYALMARASLAEAIDRIAALAKQHDDARERAKAIAADVHAWCDLAERYATLIATEEGCT